MALPAPGSRLRGVGLGLRWDFLEEVATGPLLPVDFFEVSPENYLRRRGWVPDRLKQVAERYPISSHGLSLSIGSTRPLDTQLLSELRAWLKTTAAPWHSDHLCLASTTNYHLHDLIAVSRNRASVERIVDRARMLRDALGCPFVLENISWYSELGHSTLPEAEFITEVVERSDCGLLLDVNNVYVNACNHGFDPEAFIDALPLERVVEIHVAGHLKRADGWLLDTHGTTVIEPVYQLLERALKRCGPVPVLLERDNEVPPLEELLAELAHLRQVVSRALEVSSAP